MCARRDQSERFFCGPAEIFADSGGGAGAFLRVVLERVPQGNRRLCRARNFLIWQVLNITADQGNGAGRVLDTLPEIVLVHGFHGALEVFQFFPRGSGGCRQAVGRFFVFCIDGGGGNGNPRRRRSDSGQGRGGHLSGCFRCVPQGVQVFACGFTRLFQ